MNDADAQRQATAWLVLRMAALGPLAAGMGARHRRAGVKLARLVVRHRARLPPSVRDLLLTGVPWFDCRVPGALDLLVDIARSGEDELLAMPDFPLERARTDGRAWPGLAPRLARLLDEPQLRTESRRMALELLGLSGGEGAWPQVERALRDPHLGVRGAALGLLLDARRVAASEVLRLLDELVQSPPGDAAGLGDQDDDDWACYGATLLDALASTRPPGGDRLLLALHRDDALRDHPGDRWALSALAAAYPDAALAPLDAELACVDSPVRRGALEALARLPAADARPRLLRAATDGDPRVAGRARALHLRLFGVPCPATPLDAIALPRPARAEMARRLEVVLARPLEPRGRLVRLLLAERRDPRRDGESLALLELALASGELVGSPAAPRGLPGDRVGWCLRVFARFGSPGLRLLFRLDERAPLGEGTWLDGLAEMARRGLLRRPDRELLRGHTERALVALGEVDGERERTLVALRILERVGVSGPALDRIWSLALDGESDLATAAARVLRALADRPSIDERAGEEMERALALRDFRLVHAAARIGVRRGARRCLRVARRVLLEHGGDHAARAAVTLCAQGLDRAGRLSLRWLLSALARPPSVDFAAATRLTSLPGDRERELLESALTSTARAGAAASEAAHRLVLLDPPRQPADLRYHRTLTLAPPRERLSLLDLMWTCGAPFSLLRPHFSTLLRAGDAAIAPGLVRLLPRLGAAAPALLRGALPEVRDPSLRASIEEELRIDALRSRRSDETPF